MNTSKYIIQLDQFHGTMLEVVCQGLEKNLARQIEEDRTRKKKWGGLFYKPTPGIQQINQMAVAIQDVRRTLLTKMTNCTGQLVVNEGMANLLMTALMIAKGGSAEKPDSKMKKDAVAAIDSLINQLPFNTTTTTDNVTFWHDIGETTRNAK
jgi:hypothetical protein